MKIRDLPRPVVAAKADWLAGDTWLGFTPSGKGPSARSQCQATISSQFRKGYVIEYITQMFDTPNAGFVNDERYLSERDEHALIAGRFLAVHRLRYSSRPLIDIIGREEYEYIQDMWSKDSERQRWSVAFPIIESFRILGTPKAREVLGDQAYRRLFAHPSATLRALNDEERDLVADLDIERREAKNARIAIEDEFDPASRSEIDRRLEKLVDHDLDIAAFEGWSEEARIKIRRRAAWLADQFARRRFKASDMTCDECGFDPSSRVEPPVRLRSIMDVHHNNPIAEGIRYTSLSDFSLLCPTCHRIEHARIRAARSSPS